MSTSFSLLCLSILSVLVSFLPSPISADLVPGFRPPAIPLFAFSPALHAWTRADRLTDESPTHWFIGQNSTLTGYLRVDGTAYRWLGIDTITPPFSNSLVGSPHTDRPGQDLPGSPVKLPTTATAIDCAVLCTLNVDCLSWSFSPYNTSGPCTQSAATCSLRGSAGTPQADQCRTSGTPPVHWNSTYTDGVPSTDRSGNDLRDFDAPASFTSRDCAKACWNTQGCGGFVFAHRGCDDRRDATHCWIKGTPIAPAVRYGSDCRQAGLGPQSAGWYAPAWRAATPVMPQTSVKVQPTSDHRGVRHRGSAADSHLDSAGLPPRPVRLLTRARVRDGGGGVGGR